MQRHTLERSPDPLGRSNQDPLNLDARDPAMVHPVLSRLVEEVRNEKQVEANYDRVHNRHNRGK